MRWIALPLLAATLLGWSGFLDRLDALTVETARLAAASEEAPQATREAAAEVAPLPDIARLTSHQADAFAVLGDALQVSARRVFRLNDSLGAQTGDIGDLVAGIGSVDRTLRCVGTRLRSLLQTSARVPPLVDDVRSVLARVEQTQRRSIRHLKSINRKLTALGVAAQASDVEAPPPPRIPDILLPEEGAGSIPCRGR